MMSLANIPMIVLFGPTNSDKFAPKRDNVIILDSKKLYNTSDISKISVDDVELVAENIIGKINGLYPFPGAFFLYKGERYKILKAELSNTAGDQGVILNDNFETKEIQENENSIDVFTKKILNNSV